MILQQVINGLALGMVYALVAVGYSLIFGILRLLNMAHGSIYALGAHLITVFISVNLGFIPAAIFSMMLTNLVSVFFDRILLMPLRRKQTSGITSLITTIGFSYVIQNLLMIIFGSQTRSFPGVLNFGSWTVGSFSFQSSQVIIFAVSLILLLLLTLLVNKSKIGLAMRAVEQNEKGAMIVGINVRNVVTFTFFLSGVSAAVAGSLIAAYYQMVYFDMGVLIGIKAFSAAVVGGIGVLHGSVIGGLLIGVAECLAVPFLGGSFRDSAAFIFLFIVLIIRPNGLFGKKGITKV